jgi:hypothetical protein
MSRPVPQEYLDARHADGSPVPRDAVEALYAILQAARGVTGWPGQPLLPLGEAVERLATALYDHEGVTTGHWTVR